jgi:hypothetical protein
VYNQSQNLWHQRFVQMYSSQCECFTRYYTTLWSPTTCKLFSSCACLPSSLARWRLADESDLKGPFVVFTPRELSYRNDFQGRSIHVQSALLKWCPVGAPLGTFFLGGSRLPYLAMLHHCETRVARWSTWYDREIVIDRSHKTRKIIFIIIFWYL